MTRTVVSVTRQGDFVRSGPHIADEVGIKNLSKSKISCFSSDWDIQGRGEYDNLESDPE